MKIQWDAVRGRTVRDIRHPRRRAAILVLAGAAGLAACGGGQTAEPAPPAAAADAAAAGVRLVQLQDVAPLVAGGITVIDVRTPEEFAAGHLDGASMIDIYEADFADRIGELDRDGSYLVYCRSGNRSGQAVALMAQLGFTDVADLDGGVLAYQAAGLPLVP